MSDSDWNRGEVAKCPSCDAPNNAWSSSDGGMVEKPTEGAVSLCFHCGALCIYTSANTMRAANDLEEAELARDPMVIRARKVLTYTDSPQLAASLLMIDA